VHPLQKAIAAVRGVVGLVVGIEHAITQCCRDGLGPVVADRAEALRGRAVGDAAAVALGVDEPFVVDAVMRVDAGACSVIDIFSVTFRAPTIPYRLRLGGPTGILTPPNAVTIDAVSLRFAPTPRSGLEGSSNVSFVPTRVQMRSRPPMNVSFRAMIAPMNAPSKCLRLSPKLKKKGFVGNGPTPVFPARLVAHR
jgi:hypothetical protein